MRRTTQRVFVIGFDGMDPTLARKWMDEGKLPNMKRLARGRGFKPLGTTQPSESPTAWASFATGVNAGKHNIYDFLVRDTTTYLPDLGMVQRSAEVPVQQHPDLGPKVNRPAAARRSGYRGARRRPSSMLTVPVTFPPEDVDHGEMLVGLPLPDIRGTMGTFSYYATDLSRYEEGNTEMGGILKRLVFEGDTAHTELVGPAESDCPAAARAASRASAAQRCGSRRIAELRPTRHPLAGDVRWDRRRRRATVSIDGQYVHLARRVERLDRSRFPDQLHLRLHGMAQFYLVRSGRSCSSTPRR